MRGMMDFSPFFYTGEQTLRFYFKVVYMGIPKQMRLFLTHLGWEKAFY